MTKQEYIDRVITLLNENKKDDFEYDITLQNDLENLIISVFESAYNKCLSFVPRTYFPLCQVINQPVNLKNGSGYLELPDNFKELEKFFVGGWKKPVTNLYNEKDFEASLQANKYASGTKNNPVCIRENIVTETGQIIDAIHFYPYPLHRQDIFVTSLYTPKCWDIKGKNQNEELDFEDELLNPLCFIAASLVYKILEKYDIANVLEQEAITQVVGLPIKQ